jgi:type IV secretory pathway ATPase VirB11/archaellum biosynthesis ATPase
VEYFLAPIGKLLEDESITEIMVNGFDQIYIERRVKGSPAGEVFPSSWSEKYSKGKWAHRLKFISEKVLLRTNMDHLKSVKTDWKEKRLYGEVNV